MCVRGGGLHISQHDGPADHSALFRYAGSSVDVPLTIILR